ncbi:MAG: helix-turn-helix domain-containing protein [Dehalococcoidia bacterium]
MSTQQTQIYERAALGTEAGAGYIGVSRPTLYRLLDSGEIPSFHIGRRRLIRKADLDKFIEDRMAEEGQ